MIFELMIILIVRTVWLYFSNSHIPEMAFVVELEFFVFYTEYIHFIYRLFA